MFTFVKALKVKQFSPDKIPFTGRRKKVSDTGTEVSTQS